MFRSPIRLAFRVILAIACGASLIATPASAQQRFPDKPITMVVPFAAGGAVDVTTRIICEEAEKTLGQKILIVNKAGGGATEGQGFVARSKPDGYTLLAASSSLVTNTITKNVDYTVDSFEPLALYNYDPDVMLVPASGPQTIEQLMAQAKKESLSSVTSGHSTAHHIAYLLLEKAAGVKFKYIHTKGGSEAVPMVAGGHAKTLLGAWGEASNMVSQGKLRPLAVMSRERDPRFPDLPTFKEKGWDVAYGAWRGFVAPKGLPKEVKDKLTQAFIAAMRSEQVKDKFTKADYTIFVKGPEEFGTLIKTDYQNVKQILEGLKAEGGK